MTYPRLSTLRKRIGPEMRKVWGSVHQLANGPAAHKIKSRWKKLKKSTASSTNSSNWGLQVGLVLFCVCVRNLCFLMINFVLFITK